VTAAAVVAAAEGGGAKDELRDLVLLDVKCVCFRLVFLGCWWMGWVVVLATACFLLRLLLPMPTTVSHSLASFSTLHHQNTRGPAELKKRLRTELLRWHPDKMTARLAGRLVQPDQEAVVAGVRAVAQQLTGLMSSSGVGGG